jgi:hypothetical protein
MTTTAGHSFYIDRTNWFFLLPGERYRLLRASGVFKFSLEVSTECFSFILIIEFQPLFLSKNS